jgi:hypothetical protein
LRSNANGKTTRPNQRARPDPAQPPHVSQVPGQPSSLPPAASSPDPFGPFLPHDDLLPIEIEVLDPKIETLVQPDPDPHSTMTISRSVPVTCFRIALISPG